MLYNNCLFSIPGPYPIDKEIAFENDVENKLRKFAEENGINPDSFDFKASLVAGKEKRGDNDREYITPLIAFFEYFILEFADD